jgi:pSer/pThr/pTyr-binding forkhead associated (FHA) protein
VTDVFCNQCGHRNPQNANFCSSCGAVLEPAREDKTATLNTVEPAVEAPDDDVSFSLDDLPEGAGLLVVKRGPGAGSRFTLDTDVTLAGRHPESDIFLDDITVSRRHAEIMRSGDGYTVRDAGSLNGTYVNRERIDEAPLANGDELQIGAFKLVFFAGAPRG